MNITSILKLTTIFLAFAISAFAYVVEWSEDFSTNVTLNTATTGLSAADWYISGAGVTNTGDNATVELDAVNNRVLLSTGVQGNSGVVVLGAFGQGQGTPLAGRRVSPGNYEVTHTFDFINFRNGQADLTVRSRGLDGYVQYKISPSGKFQFTHWWSNYVFRNFNSFNGPASLRNNANNPGIVIETGGSFDPTSADPVTITISGNAEGEVVMSDDGTAVASVTLTNYGSGYTADPTVTFAGGGMTESPTVSFNYETGNSNILANGDSATNNVTVNNLGNDTNPIVDGDSITISQIYDAATDSISYFYGLNGDPVTNLITTVFPATNSAGGYGFYDVVTGNRYSGTPQNKDAVYLRYQQWGSTTDNGGVASIALSNYALVTSVDADSDGVIDRDDVFPNNPAEWADTDSDGVGDNSDAHPGFDDSVLTPYVNSWLFNNNYVLDDGSTGGLTEADLVDLRVGSTGISVSGGSAKMTIQLQESADSETWSSSGSPAVITVPASDNASFFRVKAE